MKSSFDLSRRWRTTTALCIVSTLAVATASYGAEWGRSNWDKRSHSHSGNHDQHDNDGGHDQHDHDSNNDQHDHDGNNNGNGPGQSKTASPIKHVIILIGEKSALQHRPRGR